MLARRLYDTWRFLEKKIQNFRTRFIYALKSKSKMASEIIENICLAIWRLEKSVEKSAWVDGDLVDYIKHFIVYQIASYFIKDLLIDKLIKLMMACNVFTRNREFRILFGMPPKKKIKWKLSVSTQDDNGYIVHAMYFIVVSL